LCWRYQVAQMTQPISVQSIRRCSRTYAPICINSHHGKKKCWAVRAKQCTFAHVRVYELRDQSTIKEPVHELRENDRQGGVHGCGADLRFMQDSLGAAKGPRRGLIDANGSRLSILHSIDFGDGVHQRLGPNGPQC